jgi:hypothetical protein
MKVSALAQRYSQLFACQKGTYTFKYLVILMHYIKLSNVKKFNHVLREDSTVG